MFKMELTDGYGRPFDANRFRREFEQGIQNAIEKIKDNIGDEARNTMCPVHHQRPTVIRTAQGFDVKGCCPTLIDAVRARLRK